MNDNILKFLSNARKNTYAADKEPQIVNNGKTYSIKENNLEYRDTYFDQDRFVQGQELIFKSEKPIWSMSYRGAAEKGADTKKVFGFLQKILREHSEKVRLPGNHKYQEGNWKYKDNCVGDLEEFSGEEKIYQNGKLVHWMKYFGGEIK